MKRMALGLAALVVVTLGFGFGLAVLTGSFPARAAPAVVYVNDNLLPDIEGCNDAANKEDTIADGIVAADAEDTVIVCEGEYDGVTINKKVTIEGHPDADRDKVVVKDAGGGFDVTADGVTVRHLTFDGVNKTSIGIHVTGDGANIEDVELFNWDHAITLDVTIDSVVEDSSIHDNPNMGIFVVGGEDNTIRRSTFGTGSDTGVVIDGAWDVLVEENDLSGSDEALRLGSGFAPLQVHVVRNTIHAGSDGIYIDPIDSAESLIVIGGSPEDTNNFVGSPDGVTDFFVEMACGAGPPDSEVTVNAIHNYWAGNITRDSIKALIWDDEFDDDCGTPHGAIVFDPWATAAWTPTPSPTPSPTATATPTPARDFDLPAGWNDFVWTGASDTAPATALGCIVGDYVIAYRFMEATQTFQRYVPDDALLSNMTNVDKYDSLLVLVAPAATQCLGMPVIP